MTRTQDKSYQDIIDMWEKSAEIHQETVSSVYGIYRSSEEYLDSDWAGIARIFQRKLSNYIQDRLFEKMNLGSEQDEAQIAERALLDGIEPQNYD